MNRICITGRLVFPPEIRRTDGGDLYATVMVAVKRRHKNRAGERETDFFRCTAWRNEAEYIEAYGDKGLVIAVDGEMQQRKYTAQDGSQRVTFEIAVDRVEIERKRGEKDERDLGTDQGVGSC